MMQVTKATMTMIPCAERLPATDLECLAIHNSGAVRAVRFIKDANARSVLTKLSFDGDAFIWGGGFAPPSEYKGWFEFKEQ